MSLCVAFLRVWWSRRFLLSSPSKMLFWPIRVLDSVALDMTSLVFDLVWVRILFYSLLAMSFKAGLFKSMARDPILIGVGLDPCVFANIWFEFDRELLIESPLYAACFAPLSIAVTALAVWLRGVRDLFERFYALLLFVAVSRAFGTYSKLAAVDYFFLNAVT